MMSRKPLIGLNADFRNATKDAPGFAYLAEGYFDSVSDAGGAPAIFPPTADAADIRQIAEMVDGFVMVGGADLNPNRDGFMMHPSVRCLADRREDFDRALIKQLAELRKPVFGIGVGMQLLNVSQGGNLFLHIPEDLPKALPHRDAIDASHRHGLLVVPGTLMERIYGDGEVRVNSLHHMAIDEVAAGFKVSATSPDGVIEAIESIQEDWFAFGTQFHPENASATALDQRIFEEFVVGVLAAQEMKMVA